MVAPALDAWELNVLGVYDVVSWSPTTGLESWFAFLRSSGHLDGDVCEFGVFRGRSLVGAALLLATLGDDRRVLGFDTFAGFPDLAHEDEPERFEELAASGAISPEHLALVKRNRELLGLVGRSPDPRRSSTSGAFDATSVEHVRERARIVGVEDRITLNAGEFADTLALPEHADRTISGALIDSDLHDGYATVLPWAYDRLQPGGMLYLDEYFSLKFPGPRIAVDAFCAERGIRPTLLRRDGAFERWAILK